MAGLTTLNADISESVTSFLLATSVSVNIKTWLIDDELIKVLQYDDAGTSNDVDNCVRGFGNSVAAAHSEGASMYQVVGVIGSGDGFVVNFIDIEEGSTTVQTRSIGSGGGGGGGGSADVVSKVLANGIIADLELPPNTNVVLIDARPQPWVANKQYTVQTLTGFPNIVGTVIPSDAEDLDVVFAAITAATGLGGHTEPEWGAGDVQDGTVKWSSQEYDADGWQADKLGTDYSSNQIIAESYVFQLQDPNAGTGGSDEPDWSTVQGFGDTIVDGDLTWINNGFVATWTADEMWDFPVSPTDGPVSPHILPTDLGDAPGLVYVWDGFLSPIFAQSGEEEPEWDTANGHYTLDGNIVWQAQDASSCVAFITGIQAPADENSPQVLHLVNWFGGLMQVWDDHSLAAIDDPVGSEIRSSEGNRINYWQNVIATNGDYIDVNQRQSVLLAYVDGAWEEMTGWGNAD